MSIRHLLFVVGTHLLPSKVAPRGEFACRSVDLATVRAEIEGQCSKLIEITPDQWAFLRGVYAMNLEAPSGLPCGDHVVLAQGGGDSDVLLFFVDGDRLGAPMHAPPTLLSLMEQQRWQTKRDVLNSPTVSARTTAPRKDSNPPRSKVAILSRL